MADIRALLSTALRQAKVPSKDTPSWKTHLHDGVPRTIVENAVEKADADLLVLGSRGYSGVACAFLGTVAGDVLRAGTCNVLLVPPRRESSRTDPTKPRPRT
jgi:nucleotide-binding universal stress UspA family protein